MRCTDAPTAGLGRGPSARAIARPSIIADMPERPVPFSLLDAARVVARGGTFDSKLAALSEQARLRPPTPAPWPSCSTTPTPTCCSPSTASWSCRSAPPTPTPPAPLADRQPVIRSGVAESLTGRACPERPPACSRRSWSRTRTAPSSRACWRSAGRPRSRPSTRCPMPSSPSPTWPRSPSARRACATPSGSSPTTPTASRTPTG